MCVGAAGVIDAAWLLRMGENARQAATMSRAIKGMSQRNVRLNIGLPSFSCSYSSSFNSCGATPLVRTFPTFPLPRVLTTTVRTDGFCWRAAQRLSNRGTDAGRVSRGSTRQKVLSCPT